MDEPIGRSRSDNQRIANRIRRLLNRRGWSAASLARLIGIGEDQSRKYLRMDRGYQKWPFWLIWAAAAYLDVEVEALISPKRHTENYGAWSAAHDHPNQLQQVIARAEEESQSKRSIFTVIPCAYLTPTVFDRVTYSQSQQYSCHPSGDLIRDRFVEIGQQRQAAFLKNGISYQVRSFILRSSFDCLLNQWYPYNDCTLTIIYNQLKHLLDDCVGRRDAPLVILNDRKMPIDLIARLRRADSSMLFGTSLLVRREHNLMISWSRQEAAVQRTSGLLAGLEKFAIHEPSKNGLRAWLQRHLNRCESMLEKFT